MHEKDVELARLLLGKLDQLGAQHAQLAGELSQVQSDLAAQQQQRDERAAYLDILSRAAELLNRQDLHEDLPETSALEQHAAQLQGQLDEIEQVAAQYRELVEGLGQRAPQLIAYARGDEPAAPAAKEAAASHAGVELTAFQGMDAETPSLELAEAEEPETQSAVAEPAPEPGEDEADDAAETEPDPEAAEAAIEQPAEVAATEASGDSAEETDAPQEAGSETAAASGMDSDAKASLHRFNLSNLKRRESFTHGRGAAYIIDASSVLERVPNYDHYVRGIELEQAREELIHDFDVLGRELSGTFHLVFSSWFQYKVTHGNNLTVEFGSGPAEGTKEASDNRLRELVFEMTAKLRPVCVVTGDSAMADNVRGQGIHIIPLGEFFRA